MRMTLTHYTLQMFMLINRQEEKVGGMKFSGQQQRLQK